MIKTYILNVNSNPYIYQTIIIIIIVIIIIIIIIIINLSKKNM